MDRKLLPLFSTPLYTTVIESLPEKEKQYLLNTKYKRTRLDNGDISVDTNILDNAECCGIRKLIGEELDVFINNLGIDPNVQFSIKNSWVVKHHKKDWSQRHIHSNSLISGVLYLKVTNNSGDIIFRKGVQNSGIGLTSIRLALSQDNIFNLDEYAIKPVNNQIVLFPSILQHDVTENMSDDDRYVLSFNVFPVGKLGNSKSLDELDL